jgi:dipeptidyl aminopeptidase/acylaminoacyl peptidase
MRIVLVIGFFFLSSLAGSQSTSSPKLLEANLTYLSGALRIKAFTVRPQRPGRLPAVILNHGGVDGISESTKARARELARAGFAVFASAYRGEDGSDGRIEIAKGEVDDVLNGMKWFNAQPYVNQARVSMFGTSHGALIGLIAASRTANLRALVFAYGVADIYAWYQYLVDSKQLGQDALTKEIYGNGPEEKPQNFLERHGLRVVPRLSSKLRVLIQQGAKDTIVPLDQAQRLARELETRGKPYRLEVYPNSAHGFITSREAVLKKYGKASSEYAESVDAWNDAVRFLEAASR